MPSLRTDHRNNVHNPNSPRHGPQSRARWVKVVVAAAILGLVIFGLNRVLYWTMNLIGTMNTIADSRRFTKAMALALVLYAIMLTVPFMPGVEVGIALLLLRGAEIAPYVYIATVCGVMLAYSIGRWIPLKMLRHLCESFGMPKVSAFLTKIENTPAMQRLDAQRTYLPGWLARMTVDYRYVTLGILLNLPGTFAIGGGGGIALVAGFSRLFNSWFVLLTVMIATSPVPLTVWLLGRSVIA